MVHIYCAQTSTDAAEVRWKLTWRPEWLSSGPDFQGSIFEGPSVSMPCPPANSKSDPSPFMSQNRGAAWFHAKTGGITHTHPNTSVGCFLGIPRTGASNLEWHGVHDNLRSLSKIHKKIAVHHRFQQINNHLQTGTSLPNLFFNSSSSFIKLINYNPIDFLQPSNWWIPSSGACKGGEAFAGFAPSTSGWSLPAWKTWTRTWRSHGRSRGGVSIAMGVPPKRMLCKGKCQSKMDDDWGYPYSRKPPYTLLKKITDCWLIYRWVSVAMDQPPCILLKLKHIKTSI